VSELVVGLSHRTAPITFLERVTLGAAAARALEADLVRREHVAEAVVLSTCNRLEVYADVPKFHGGVDDVCEALAAAAGVEVDELTEHLYVHYETAAVAHLFAVACGLESMAVGEQQILGQVRAALRAGQAGGSAGRVLGGLLQRALHVGKRAHSETGLDQAGRSLVQAGLDAAAAVVGPLPDARVLVVGAGAISGLVVAGLQRCGVRHLTLANRTRERALRLAEPADACVVAMDELPGALAAADVVVSCTGAVGQVIPASLVSAAAAARGDRAKGPQVYVDLALPRDVEPGAAGVPGVTVLDLEALGRELAGTGTGTGTGIADAGIAGVGQDLEQARAIVAQEVAAYLTAQRAQVVAPTVVALRARARAVVEAELARLEARVGDLDPVVRAELELAVHRVVEKLLHTPTVRVKQLAEAPGGAVYADALRELFDLDPATVSAVTVGAVPGAVDVRPDVEPPAPVRRGGAA
jgi:glutamyl-tRNA reductase